MTPVAPTSWFTVLFVLFIAWRIYRRFRQHIGRQELKTKRVIFRVVIYCAVSLFFGIAARDNSKELFGWGAGLLTGLPLAWLGFHLTRFENTPEGRFYTPNPLLGMAMSLLFVSRLAYRMLAAMPAVSHGDVPTGTILQSPLTLYLFELIAGYFATYYIGVLIRCHSTPLPCAAPEAPQQTR